MASIRNDFENDRLSLFSLFCIQLNYVEYEWAQLKNSVEEVNEQMKKEHEIQEESRLSAQQALKTLKPIRKEVSEIILQIVESQKNDVEMKILEKRNAEAATEISFLQETLAQTRSIREDVSFYLMMNVLILHRMLIS